MSGCLDDEEWSDVDGWRLLILKSVAGEGREFELEYVSTVQQSTQVIRYEYSVVTGTGTRVVFGAA